MPNRSSVRVPRALTGIDRTLRIGVAAVTVLATLVGGAVFIHSLHLGKATYTADFAQVAGLGPGDPVTLAGIPVGTVTATELDGDHVAVTMKIDDSVPLGERTGAAIKLTTLLGSRYVELRPAGTGRLDGGRIPLSRTEVPYDLETALQQATTTFGQVDADKIARSMDTLSQQLRGSPTLVPDLLANVRNLSTVIASRRDQIGQLLTATSQVTTVIRDQQADLGVLVDRGRSVLQQISANRAAIERMLAATTSLVRQLEPIAVGDQDDIAKLLTDLETMTTMIAHNDDLMRNTLQILPVPWRLFANATGTGQEMVANLPDGLFLDSFMCALSGRAEQLDRPPYLKDCE
ncbi:MCE family protein [Nocardia bovistercoris]|uniref:MCE family protein n=1 Tax=Nocardia bovistercoris TaxID=2785916 RepID=A0A931I8G9_9NOCA|nr:MCE family protein [Nocardia bovistercoris]MBH0776604.1 MCE family protein [Nocardia bovistercoris]